MHAVFEEILEYKHQDYETMREDNETMIKGFWIYWIYYMLVY